MLIALSAKKRRGKDTVAKMMSERGFVTYALANPIRKYLLMALPESCLPDFISKFTLDDFEGNGYDREKALPISNVDAANIFCTAWHYYSKEFSLTQEISRKVYVHIDELCYANTEAWSIRRLMQTFGTDIGCWFNKNIWLDFADEVIAINKDVVITDCRQPWEYEYATKKDGVIVHILRDIPEADDAHSTEQGLPIDYEEDFVINNNSSKDELRCNVDLIIDSLGK